MSEWPKRSEHTIELIAEVERIIRDTALMSQGDANALAVRIVDHVDAARHRSEPSRAPRKGAAAT
jgi:hypothetical protein